MAVRNIDVIFVYNKHNFIFISDYLFQKKTLSLCSAFKRKKLSCLVEIIWNTMCRRFLQMVGFNIGLNPFAVLIKSSASIGKYQGNDWGNKFCEDSEGWGQWQLRLPFTRAETMSFVNLNTHHDVKINGVFVNLTSFFQHILFMIWHKIKHQYD